MKHPIQPIALDPNGTPRFKENKIVRYLVDHGDIDLNQIACMEFPADDREQFWQLIGYSLSGYGELSFVSDETYNTAERMHETGVTEGQARLAVIEETLQTARDKMREGVAALYGIHPENLTRS